MTSDSGGVPLVRVTTWKSILGPWTTKVPGKKILWTKLLPHKKASDGVVGWPSTTVTILPQMSPTILL